MLHVTPYFGWAWAYGGIPRVVADQVQGLADRGHRVQVATTDACDGHRRHPPTAPSHLSPQRGLDVHVVRNWSNRLAYRWQFFTPRGFGRLVEDLARSVAVAHLHGFHNLPGVIAARRLHRAGIPYVVQPNGTLPRIERRRTAKWVFDMALGNRVLHGAAGVVAVTEVERRQLQQRLSGSQRLWVVPNPVADDIAPAPDRGEAFRSRWGLGGDRVVLYLGQLSPRKGVHHLVRAMARLGVEGGRLVVAGADMGEGPRLRRLATELGVADRAVFTGVVEGAKRCEALTAADVVVYPSRDEIFGLVPLEALLCGTPVVVSDDCGCGEVVGRVGGGRVVGYGDAEAIARAILTPPAEESVVEAAKRIRSWCSRRAVAAQLEAVYLELLETGG